MAIADAGSNEDPKLTRIEAVVNNGDGGRICSSATKPRVLVKFSVVTKSAMLPETTVTTANPERGTSAAKAASIFPEQHKKRSRRMAYRTISPRHSDNAGEVQSNVQRQSEFIRSESSYRFARPRFYFLGVSFWPPSRSKILFTGEAFSSEDTVVPSVFGFPLNASMMRPTAPAGLSSDGRNFCF